MHSTLGQGIADYIRLWFFVDSSSSSEGNQSSCSEVFRGEMGSQQSWVEIYLAHFAYFIEVIIVFDAAARPSSGRNNDGV